MSKCKRTGFDLEKMEDLEEEKMLKKKKGREMEEGPGRPSRFFLDSLARCRRRRSYQAASGAGDILVTGGCLRHKVAPNAPK